MWGTVCLLTTPAFAPTCCSRASAELASGIPPAHRPDASLSWKGCTSPFRPLSQTSLKTLAGLTPSQNDLRLEVGRVFALELLAWNRIGYQEITHERQSKEDKRPLFQNS